MTWEDVIKEKSTNLLDAMDYIDKAIISLARTGEHGEVRMELTRILSKLEDQI